MTKIERIPEWGALGMVMVAIVVVSFLAINGSEQAEGALIAVIATGTSYFLRGKVEKT